MKFKNVTVYIKTVNGDFPIHRNNEYVKYNEQEIAHIFNLEVSNAFDYNCKQRFNTNQCPFVFSGYKDNFDALVQIDMGSYHSKKVYHTNTVKTLFEQCFFAEIELTDGSVYTVDCDNVKGEFHLTFIDVYCILFNEELTEDQKKELQNLKMKKVFLIFGEANVEAFEDNYLDEIAMCQVHSFQFKTIEEKNAFCKGVQVSNFDFNYTFITQEEYNEIIYP